MTIIMPVTQTAKRALRTSGRKAAVNNLTKKNLEIAIRLAQKTKKRADIMKAITLADRAAQKNVIHKNKAARIKSRLSKLTTK
jgi:small subunit ribosomal protein S20